MLSAVDCLGHDCACFAPDTEESAGINSSSGEWLYLDILGNNHNRYLPLVGLQRVNDQITVVVAIRVN